MKFYAMLRAARRSDPPDTRPALFPPLHYAVATALLALIGLWGNPVTAGDATRAIRIEEDWEVEIGTPEPAGNAPQIINVFSPRQSLSGAYAVFEVNHSTQPTYSAGGMQLQCWVGLGTKTSTIARRYRVAPWTPKMN